MINVMCRWHCAELWIPSWKKGVTECNLSLPIMFFTTFIIFDKWCLMGIFGISVGLTQCRAQHCQGIILHSGFRLGGGDCRVRSASSTRNTRYQKWRIVEFFFQKRTLCLWLISLCMLFFLCMKKTYIRWICILTSGLMSLPTRYR